MVAVNALLVTTFVGSVLGSVHCLTMCGPLLTMLAEPGRGTTFGLAAWHSLGRLLTYASLGAAAGALGKALDVAGRVANVQRTAAIVSAIVLIGFAIVTMWPRAARAANLPRPMQHALVQLRARKTPRTVALFGMVTGLLPCGWLWAFLVTAGGTASVLSGAIVMAAFWVGTLPAMLGILSIAGPWLARLRAHRPALMGVVLVSLGLFTLWQRWPNAGSAGISAPSCHDPATGQPRTTP